MARSQLYINVIDSAARVIISLVGQLDSKFVWHNAWSTVEDRYGLTLQLGFFETHAMMPRNE